jgi:cyanophycinase
MGYILLAGGAEFGGRMAKPDRRAIELAGGFRARVSIIPAAAAPDNNLIYMLGGFSRHLAQSLAGSDSWQAMLAAHQSGAVIAGSSAGAMILCDHYYDPYEKNIFSGLGLIPGACILPHHDTFGKSWAPELAQRMANVILIGIDEQTGMLNDGPANCWQVYGAGGVTLYVNDREVHFTSGKRFDLKF